MSATGRNLEGHERWADDFYATPHWCTRAILPHLTRGPVLDPFCGEGAILDVVAAEWSVGTYGYEVDEVCATKAGVHHAVTLRNSLAIEGWYPALGTQVITNPPYESALPSVMRSIAEVGGDKAYLLRLSFLESEERAFFHRKFPADVFVLPTRPGFMLAISCKKRGDGSKGCGWGDYLSLNPATCQPYEPPTKVCPSCGNAKLSKSSSDASAYAWFVWGEGRGNRWRMLDVVG